MVAEVEAGQAWLESITLQMCKMVRAYPSASPPAPADPIPVSLAQTKAESAKYLAGPIGLLKGYLTRTETMIADRAVQIFGGRALSTTGMGAMIAGFNKTHHFNSVLGGTEDILYDLGIKQAMKNRDKWSKL